MFKSLINLSKPLIETGELAKIVKSKSKNLTIVNANFAIDYKTHVIRPADTWYDIFKNERIPLSRHVNISMIGDKSQGLQNMLPTFNDFTKVMRELDIGKNDHVVCYGDENIVGACRAWWMFKIFGFPNVQVMNGTFNKWKKDAYDVESGEEQWKNNLRERTNKDFEFEFNKELVINMQQIRDSLNNPSNDLCVVDARSEGRFEGRSPDPKGLKVGHIPGAKNIQFTDFLKVEQDDTFRLPDEMLTIAKSKNVDFNKYLSMSCGSGMTASVVLLGLYMVGAPRLSIYDGSWSEWAKYAENPVETGPAK